MPRTRHILFPFLLALVLPASASSPTFAEELLGCFNGQEQPQPASFETFLDQKPPHLLIHKIWRSSHLKGSSDSKVGSSSSSSGDLNSDAPLTVVTAATLSRLDALDAQCSSWAGPLTAAIYLPLLVDQSHMTGSSPSAIAFEGVDSSPLIAALNEDHRGQLEEAGRLMQELFDRSEARLAAHQSSGDETSSSSCHFSALMLLYELVLDSTVASLIPINSLRSAALVAAETPLVAMIDVDLMVSRSLSDGLAEGGNGQKTGSGKSVAGVELLEAAAASSDPRHLRRRVWVLPAFETPKNIGLEEGRQLVEDAVAGGKASLGPLISSRKLQPFASVFYPKGHACTDFKRWYGTDPGSSSFAMNYTVNCEPWFILDRLACPPYDARFRGYGWNKVQQVALVNASGFEFLVHPAAFLAHRPHARSEAQGIYSSATSSTSSVTSASSASASSRSLSSSLESPGAAFRGRGLTASYGVGQIGQNLRQQQQLPNGGREGGSSSTGGAGVSVAPRGKLFHRKVAAMRHVALRDMKRGTYQPVLDPGTKACLEQLSWWKKKEIR